MVDANTAATAAASEWEQAVNWSQQIYDWCEQHPDAGLISAEQDEWERQQGIPQWGEPGRLTVGSLPRTDKRWWWIRLRQPTAWGTHVIECRQCRQTALRHSPLKGAGLCHDCRTVELEQRKVDQAERRVERRRQRSAKLANRRGLCRVCGSEMAVSRGSKVTCSDRCRKQWIRKGAEAFPLPEAPVDVRIGKAEPMLLATAHERVFDQLIRHTMARQAKRNEPDPVADDMRRILDQIIHLRSLAELRESAPAVFLLEMSRLTGSAVPEQEADSSPAAQR